MAGTRKLQSEIDRVLKKIQEGIEEFAELWDKATTASQPNLKEKYESDLKREIKKLQRHRETVKSYANNSEVKNKKPLLEARRSIEVEMERFKVLEKETKTKAYSKEGLMLAMKRSVHKDPSKDPRYPSIVWLNECIEKLKEQSEEFENQIDTIREESVGKNRKEDEQIRELQTWIDNHQVHIERLEFALDKLQADEIVFEQIEEIKDGVQYYIESFEDPDYIDDEALYDVLDESPERIEERRSARQNLDDQSRYTGEDEQDEDHEDEDETAESESTSNAASASKQGQERKTSDSTKKSATIAKGEESKTGGSKLQIQSSTTSPNAAGSANASASVTAAAAGASAAAGSVTGGSTTQFASPSGNKPASSPWGQQPGGKPMGYSAVVAKANERELANEPQSASTTTSVATASLPVSSPWGTGSAAQLVKGVQQVQPLKTSTSVPGSSQTLSQTSLQQSASVSGPQATALRSNTSPLHQSQNTAQGAQFNPFPLPGTARDGQSGQVQIQAQPSGSNVTSSQSQTHLQSQPGQNTRPIVDASASPFPSTLPLPNPHIAYLRQLEYGSKMLPDPSDVDRSRESQSLSPWSDAPKTFPLRSQASMFDAAPVYERLSTETLFFIFHEEQSCVRGSGPQLHQFLAGRELRRRGMLFYRAGGVWVTRIVDSLSAMTHQDLQTVLYQGSFPPPTGPSQFVFYFEPTHHWSVVRAETTFSTSSYEDDYGPTAHM